MSLKSTHSSTAVAVVALAVAVVALTFSISGFATAGTKTDKSAVEVLTIATGSVDVVADGQGQVAVPMENAAFTQEAGSSILFLTNVSTQGIPPEGSEGDCWGSVAWNNLGGTLFLPDTVFHYFGIWSSRQVLAIGPSDTDQYNPEMDVAAFAQCLGTDGTAPTFTVEVEVAVLTLR